MGTSGPKEFDYNKIEIGEDLGSYEYVLSQETLDNFGVDAHVVGYMTGPVISLF